MEQTELPLMGAMDSQKMTAKLLAKFLAKHSDKAIRILVKQKDTVIYLGGLNGFAFDKAHGLLALVSEASPTVPQGPKLWKPGDPL